jgi:uncharacterized membrane protein YraQ (UPF0718 family)
MLIIIVFITSIVRSYFPPERTRKILGKDKRARSFLGNVLAAVLGIVTPFCSCSAVPVFIGFVGSGIPLGVTFSFLVSSPMINEIALVMLLSVFGWKIALLYIVTGLVISVTSGIIIGKLKMERYLQEDVFNISIGESEITAKIPWKQRISDAWSFDLGLLKKIWPYVVVGIAVGAAIHGWVPGEWLSKYVGADNPLAVPLAVLFGVPLYSAAASAIPIVSELTRIGVPIGTALAFLMSVTALSLPEMIILRKVMKPKLLAVFIGIVAVSIMLIGYFFNIILR